MSSGSSRRKRRKGRRLAVAGVAVAVVAGLGLLLSHAGYGCWRGRPATNVALPAPPPAELLAGQWEGAWSSTSNDMGGKLTCEIRKLPDGAYNADFHAIFAKVLTHDSSVTLKATKDGAKWQFEGSKDLGLLSGGVYTYKGYVTADEFYSTYDSKLDRGTFRMKRPGAGGSETPKSGAATRPDGAGQ